MGTNLAENQTENKDAQENQNPNEVFDNIRKSKLTPSEIAAIQDRTVSIRDILNERNRKAHQAKNELGKLASSSKDRNQIISMREYREYSERIRETESAEKMQVILEEIKELPEKKAKEMEEEKAQRETLEKDDPRLETLQDEFDEICEDNIQFIGTKQLDGFKKWFAKEVDKKPQIKHLKDVIKRLKGDGSTDSGGLHPRIEEYGKLQKLFKKYGLEEPTDSKYIEEEGLSERREYRKNAEAIEEQLMKGKEKGFYSKEVIQETMQETLNADSQEKQKNILNSLVKVARLESEGFTHLDSNITVGGITIRKMSQKGKDFLINYYKTLSLDEREDNVRKWPEFIETEAKLAEDLLEIYEGNQEGFRLAMGSFQYLTFEEKEKALKEHEKLVKETNNKEELEKKLTIKAAHGAIDEAARKNIIAKGKDKTQGKYKEFFEEDENFKNKRTGEEGDLDEMKKAYELLINTTPNEKYKNLAAYEKHRKEYEKDVKRLGEFDDKMKEQDLKELQEEYDAEGWSDRENLQEELKKKVTKAKEENEKIKRMTKGVDLKALKKEKGIKLDKKASNENSEDIEERPKTPEAAVAAAKKLLMDDEALEALDILVQFMKDDKKENPESEGDPEVKFWLETAAKHVKELGSGKKKLGSSFEAELERELEKSMRDEDLEEDIEIEQLETLSLEGTEESERLHGNKKSAKERAEDESLGRVGTVSLEGELTQDFYENSDEEFILDKEGTGEELTEIKFDDEEYEEEEVDEFKKEVFHKQDRLREKRGLVDTILKDKDGKVITTQEAKRIQQKDVDELEEEIVDKAEESMAIKKGASEGKEVFDLTKKIAAKRKAKEMLDRRLHEKLKSEN